MFSVPLTFKEGKVEPICVTFLVNWGFSFRNILIQSVYIDFPAMLTLLNSALKNIERVNLNRVVGMMHFLISPGTKTKILKQKHYDQDSTNFGPGI